MDKYKEFENNFNFTYSPRSFPILIKKQYYLPVAPNSSIDPYTKIFLNSPESSKIPKWDGTSRNDTNINEDNNECLSSNNDKIFVCLKEYENKEEVNLNLSDAKEYKFNDGCFTNSNHRIGLCVKDNKINQIWHNKFNYWSYTNIEPELNIETDDSVCAFLPYSNNPKNDLVNNKNNCNKLNNDYSLPSDCSMICLNKGKNSRESNVINIITSNNNNNLIYSYI